MKQISQRINWSTGSAVTTIVALAILCAAFAYEFDRNPIVLIIIAAALVTVCLPALWFIPLKVTVDENELNIAFPMRNKTFRLQDISKAEPRHGRLKCFRTFGSGGVFGYWGWFRNKELGTFFAYAPDFSNYIILTLKDGQRYVISSPDPERLTEAIVRVSQ